MIIRVNLAYSNKSKGVSIACGEYSSSDTRLNGLADFLISAGHAVKIADEPEPQDTEPITETPKPSKRKRG